jgi:hypothetical protein
MTPSPMMSSVDNFKIYVPMMSPIISFKVYVLMMSLVNFNIKLPVTSFENVLKAYVTRTSSVYSLKACVL